MKNEKPNINKQICSRTEQLIDEYLEGMISLKEKEIIDKHISECADCQSYMTKTTKLIEDLNSLPDDTGTMPIKLKYDIWAAVESKIDSEKFLKDSSSDNLIPNEKKESFFEKYKYILSGVAAAVLIASLIFLIKRTDLKNLEQSPIGFSTYWKVSKVQGSPSIEGVSMQGTDSIKEGQWLVTNDTSRAELFVAGIGNVIIEPNTKIIFVKAADGNNRIAVEYGTISANMIASPKSFFVEMPSAVAVDLGGEYKMTIDSAGDGLVYVKSGKVEVQSPNREAIVPAGNLVLTKKDIGVGTPFNENSSYQFKNALLNLDFGNCGAKCVNVILENAKVTDAVTLVNLIPRVEGEYKDEVYAKVANFIPPPVPVHDDSLPFINDEKLTVWIEKIQTEVQKNIEPSIKNMEESIQHIKEAEKFGMDTIKWMNNFSKNFKVKIPKVPDVNVYQYDMDSNDYYFDNEQFKEDMEKMKIELRENVEFNKDEFKKEMEEMKENLEEMKDKLKEEQDFNNEELKKELEKVKEEIKNSVKDMNEKIKIEVNKSIDSGKYKYKYKVKDGEIEVEEEPEAPEPPEPGK